MSSRTALENKVRLQKNDLKTQWIIRFVLLVFVLITICPMLFVILTSTKTTNEFYNNIWLLPERFAWENYEYAWNIAKIGEYFGNSVIIVVITVIITLVLGAFAGYALAKLKVPQADLIMLGIFRLVKIINKGLNL